MEQVVITSSTWDRECHGLYDFDLSGIETTQNRFVGCGYVQRKGQTIRMELPGLATEQANQNNSGEIEVENLLSLVYQNQQYYAFHNQSVEADYSFKNHLKMAWLVVRYQQDVMYPNEDNIYYVEKGDIIKFGRVRFKVRELMIQGIGVDSMEEEAISHHINILHHSGNRPREVEDTLTFDENMSNNRNRTMLVDQQATISARVRQDSTMVSQYTGFETETNGDENVNFNR